MNLTDETKAHLCNDRDRHIAQLEERVRKLKALDAEGYLREEGIDHHTANDYLVARLARANVLELRYDAPNGVWFVYATVSGGGTSERKAQDEYIEKILNATSC